MASIQHTRVWVKTLCASPRGRGPREREIVVRSEKRARSLSCYIYTVLGRVQLMLNTVVFWPSTRWVRDLAGIVTKLLNWQYLIVIP